METKILVAVDNELVNDSRVVRELDVLIKNGFKLKVLCYKLETLHSPIANTYDTIRIDIKKATQNKLLPLENRLGIFTSFWKYHLKKALIMFKPDFVLAHDLYMAKPCRAAINSIKPDTQLVLDLHENYPYAILSYSYLKNPIKRLLTNPKKWLKKEGQHLGFADKIIVLDDSFGESLRRKYPSLNAKEFISYPNLLDLNRFEKYEIQTIDLPLIQRPIMFYFGAVAERRGIFDALEAFKKNILNGIKCGFVIIGPVDIGDKKRFSQSISDPSIKEHVLYKKWIDVSELPSYLNAIDFCIAPFYVNPQHESGIANKIFQYFAGKRAIIASNCKPQAKFIQNARGGIIFNDQNELVDAIRFMATHPQETKEMGLSGYHALMKEVKNKAYENSFIQLFNNQVN